MMDEFENDENITSEGELEEPAIETYDGYGPPASATPIIEESLDDTSSEYWEEHFGGPEDSESEEDVEDLDDEEDLDDDEEDDELENVSDDGIGEDDWDSLLGEFNKVTKLVQWLEKSELVNQIEGGREGFFIRPGNRCVYKTMR